MERVGGGVGRVAVGFLRYSIVWAVAMVAGTIIAFPVSVMGLVVPGVVIGPLSFGTGAIVATIVALWAGTLLNRGRTQGRPVIILGVGLSTAAVISTADLAMRLLGGSLIVVSEGVTLLIGVAVVALNASVAAWRFREAGGNLRRNALLTLVLLMLTPVVVIGVIAATCTLGSCSG